MNYNVLSIELKIWNTKRTILYYYWLYNIIWTPISFSKELSGISGKIDTKSYVFGKNKIRYNGLMENVKYD